MPQDVAPIQLSDDVDLQARLLPAWDQRYTQIEAGAFAGSVRKLRSDAICLFDESLNRQVYQAGGLPRGTLGFGLPVRVSGASHLCGQPASPGHLLVFSGASGFEFLSSRDFRFFGVEIDMTQAGDPVLKRLLGQLECAFLRLGRSIPLNLHSQDVVLRSLACVLMRQQPPPQGAGFGRQIVGSVLDCLPERDGQIIAACKHWRIVSQIRELVQDSPLCPRTVAELALSLGVSRRTLQNACRDLLDVSPVQYLRALRLCEARRAMTGAISVTDVAMQYGFWHLGYFARDYKAMFGEAPSHTLRRRAGRSEALAPSMTRGPARS